MKTLLLAGLAGAASILPATSVFAAEAVPVNGATNPARQQVVYDNGVMMNDDRVIAGQWAARGGSSIYKGNWDGAYQEDGTYQGEWRGTYRDRDGKLYKGQYAGTLIGEGNPDPEPSPQRPQINPRYAEASPVTPSGPAQIPVQVATAPAQPGTNYVAPLYQGNAPQYTQAPAPPVPAAPVAGPQSQTQYRYPSGWNGYYYPPHYPPATTTIVIHSAPGTTTTTTYYED